MKVVYVSRTGNVEAVIGKLGLNDAVKVETGDEAVNEDFVLITYTDGYGDVPMELESFLPNHKDLIKAVIVSGDLGYDDAYCVAGDKIAEEYNIPCLYKFENDGTDEDITKIKEAIASL
ncbi:MAG: class Ib ribonucleoside-diphosphate reductase assembly flavoprotein NrdI [Coprobacillaceae bacterium]